MFKPPPAHEIPDSLVEKATTGEVAEKGHTLI